MKGRWRALVGAAMCGLSAVSAAQSLRLFSTFANVGGTPDEVGRRMVRAADGSLFALGASGTGWVVAKHTSEGAVVWKAYYPATGFDLAPTPDGGALVVGRVERGNLPAVREVIVLRYDSAGAPLWARLYGSASLHPDASAGVAVDSSGNAYVGCTVNSDAFSDIAILKYSPGGDLLWEHVRGPSPEMDWCHAVAIDPGNRVVVVGHRGPAATGKPLVYRYDMAGNSLGQATINVPNPVSPLRGYAIDRMSAIVLAMGGPAPSVLKLNSRGTTQWVRALPTDASPGGVAIGPADSVYVAGGSPATGASFVRKLDTNGVILWSATHPSAGGMEQGTSVAVASDGTAYASGTRSFETTAALFTQRVTSAGAVSWHVEHGAAIYPPPPPVPVPPLPFVPPPTAVTIDSLGRGVSFGTVRGLGAASGFDLGLFATLPTGGAAWSSSGDLNGTSDFVVASASDRDGNTYVLSEAHQGGGSNANLTRFSQAGGVLWSRTFGGSRADLAYACAMMPDDGAVVAYGAYDAPTHLYDLYVRRYGPAGNLIWRAGKFAGLRIVAAAALPDASVLLLGQEQAARPFRITLMKLDPQGAVAWRTTFPGLAPNDDQPKRLALGAGGAIFVAADLWDDSRYLATVLKYSAEGSLQWIRTFARTSSGAGASGLAPDSAGGVAVCGTDWGNGARGFLHRYSTTGAVTWSFVDAGPDTVGERYVEVAFDPAGNLVVGGSGVKPDGNVDLMVAKFSGAGAPLWRRLYDGPAALRDLGRQLVVDRYGSIFLAGWVSAGPSGRDSVLWKLGPNGEAEWPSSGDGFHDGAATLEAGWGLPDSAASVTLDRWGNAYLASTSVGAQGTADPHLLKLGHTLGSEFVEQQVPTSMVAGQSYLASLTFRITGNLDWTKVGGFGVGSRNPEDHARWGTVFAPLQASDRVRPGESKRVQFWIYAPMDGGVYEGTWGMKREFAGHFGPASPAVPITVTVMPDAARYVSQSVPTSVRAGASFTVTVKMRNVGTNAWTAAAGYALAPASGSANWSVAQVPLASTETIARGAEKTFRFTCRAPETPGSYTMRWQMRRGTGFFGDRTTTKTVTVTP